MIPFVAVLAAAAATVQPATETPQEPLLVEARRILPSVGLMNDHMHQAGEFMVGVRYQHIDWGGENRWGTRALDDMDLISAGYMMRATHMSMDMAMADLMYGITDNMTVTVSPQYVWNRMTMVAIDPTGEMMPGEASKEAFHGVGDTLASVSFRATRTKRLNAHFTLGVWVPTGKAGLKNPDGTFTEYDMQTGSGTWDIEPSATVTGQAGPIGWGVQGGYRFRAETRNSEGYRLGNRGLLTGWLSYRVRPAVGATLRAEFTHQGRIQGAYDGPAFTGMPEDDPANTGGDLLIGALGLNWKPAIGMQRGPQLGIEVGLPLYQRVNGIRLPQRWQVSVGAKHFL